MKSSQFGDLEVIVRLPEGIPARATPLLFVHGAYTAAWCWDEYFLPYFAALGYPSHAVSLSGHGRSRHGKHSLLDNFSIADYVSDVEEVVAALPTPPVLIGHSMGGMVVQKYLEQADVPAAVLLCSVPPQGLMSSAFGLMFSKPGMLADLNRMMGGGTPDLDSIREALFNQPVEPERLLRYATLAQPESHRAIWDMTLFNLPHVSHMHRPPMLVLGAEHDHLISPAQVNMTGSTYALEPHIFAGMGHGVMLEQGWETVAAHIAAWLDTTLATQVTHAREA